jgi:hypothetical protein
MDNFGQGLQRTSILQELSGGNAELGEAFALILDDMITQSGIYNPQSEPFDVTPDSWRALANKPNKTPEEIKNLDDSLKSEIYSLAESFLLYMARETRNLTGKLEYQQYEAYMLKHRFGRYDVMNKPEYISQVKVKIRNAFNKISAHGEQSGDDLIDKHDMAAFIYALTTRSRRDTNGNFAGFEINGFIKPEEYAVSEHDLFESADNLFSVKLRVAHQMLNNK